LSHCFRNYGASAFPDLRRIVLNPPCLWKELAKFTIALRDNTRLVIEYDGTIAGGAKIYGQNQHGIRNYLAIDMLSIQKPTESTQNHLTR
jgi:hypothetical protein